MRTFSTGHACHGHGLDWFRTCSASDLRMHPVPCRQGTIFEERTNAMLNKSCFVHGFLMYFRSHASGLYICLRAMRSVHVPPKYFAQAAFLLADRFFKRVVFAAWNATKQHDRKNAGRLLPPRVGTIKRIYYGWSAVLSVSDCPTIEIAWAKCPTVEIVGERCPACEIVCEKCPTGARLASAALECTCA